MKNETYANRNNSQAEKATVNRTYTVSNRITLTLPLLPLHSLEIASSPEAETYVTEHLHTADMIGMPYVSLYAESGIILQTLDTTTAHVLVVANDEVALRNMAMYHHTYSRLGYTLEYDETTVLLTRPQKPEPETTSESTPPPSSTEAKPSKASASAASSQQTKLNVVGMEVA
jgi:hypothetical protein